MLNEREQERAAREFSGESPGGGMSVDEFLNHSSRGEGGQFLSGDWKDKTGEIVVWLHKRHLIYPVWHHSFYRVIEAKGKDGGPRKEMVVSTRWNCRDYQPDLGPRKADKLLRKARFRDDTGAREHPPVLCPFCKFEDWLAVEVRAGRIGFADEVFRVAPSTGERPAVLHAGGIVGFFSDRTMSDEERQLVKDARISLADAWQEKTTVRLNYLVVVVPDNSPEDGAKKMFLPEGLGDALKRTIRKEMDRRPKSRDLGNPIANPYPIKLMYDKKAKAFDDRYDVCALEEKPSDEVLDEIGGDTLDLWQELEPGNCRELRSLFEAHARIDAPWDEFFAEAERAGLMSADDRTPKRSSATNAAKAELWKCDLCDQDGLSATQNVTCSSCGARYGDDGIVAIPCVECKTPIEAKAAGEHACAKCGARHSYALEPHDEYVKAFWTRIAAAPSPAEEKPTRARRGRSPAKAGA